MNTTTMTTKQLAAYEELITASPSAITLPTVIGGRLVRSGYAIPAPMEAPTRRGYGAYKLAATERA